MVFKELSSLNSATLSCFNLGATFTFTVIKWKVVLSLVFQGKLLVQALADYCIYLKVMPQIVTEEFDMNKQPA